MVRYILAADALSVLAAFMPAVQVASIGRRLLDASRKYNKCYYRADFVIANDIPTALGALEYPACAAYYGPEIQRAIVDATTHVPAGDVDRWTFAREWVMPNAAKYGYPFRSRRRID